MRNRVLMVAAVAIATGGIPAVAMGESARNALRHAGEVMAVANMCDRLQVNEMAVSYMVLANGGDMTRADHMKVVTDQARSDLAAWRGKGKDAACVAGLLLYGPTGTSVPGLVKLTR